MPKTFVRSHTAAVEGVSIEVIGGRGFSLLGHSHADQHVLFMLRGGLIEDGRLMRCGDVRFSPGGDEHFVRGLSGAWCVLLSPNAISSRFAGDTRLTVTAPALAPLAAGLAQLVRQGQRASGDAIAHALDRLVTAAVCEHTRACEQVVPGWLIELRRELTRGDSEPIRVRDLARRAGVSREHLTRSFRRAFGSSISMFLHDIRLARAWRRVVATDWPLADVASDSGFADQSHMTRQMRSAYGVTPGFARVRPQAGITFIQDTAAALAKACQS